MQLRSCGKVKVLHGFNFCLSDLYFLSLHFAVGSTVFDQRGVNDDEESDREKVKSQKAKLDGQRAVAQRFKFSNGGLMRVES